MDTFKKVSLGVVVFSFALLLCGPNAVFSATTPGLGVAASYGILANSYTNDSLGMTVNGDIGFAGGPNVDPDGTHAHYGSDNPFADAAGKQGFVRNDLASQDCDFTFGPGTIDLSTDTTHGAAGTYAPGVYCASGTLQVGGAITLDGKGTYIFRSDSELTSSLGASVSLASEASACNVFWSVGGNVTLAAGTTFVGTALAGNDLSVGAGTVWTGRAWASDASVTTVASTITVPTCAAPFVPSNPHEGKVMVTAKVINDDGGTKKVSDFKLFVNETAVASGENNGFPAPADAYSVTETAVPNYTQTFSGDCDAGGRFNLNPGDNKFCTVTNDDIAPPPGPKIDLTETASPAALPSGPGPVTFTYTLRNSGTVPATDLTLTDDACAHVTLASGDANSDRKLDLKEVWTYTCSATVSETRTSAAVATAQANGQSAKDTAGVKVTVTPLHIGTINVTSRVVNDHGGTKSVADFNLFVNGVQVASGVTNTFPAPADGYAVTESADAGYTLTFSGDCGADGRLNLAPGENKVCFVTNDDVPAPATSAAPAKAKPAEPAGASRVPPLIDVVKIPDPPSLPSAGRVTFTYTLRNPGKATLTDVSLTDDGCSPVELVSGDANSDGKLQADETWTYACSTTVTETHTSAAVATGRANGLSATDITSATVVVGASSGVTPLIHVTTVPSPLNLPAGGGTVTYTDEVSNPGTTTIGSIRLTDDVCPNLNYILGDANGDLKLDPGEKWIYDCQIRLEKTTANTARVDGEANGQVARDYSIATVVVEPGAPTKSGALILGLSALGVGAAALLAWLIRKDMMKRKRRRSAKR